MRPIKATYVALSTLGLAMTCWVSHAATGNLLVNPGFEDGTPNEAPPWGVGGWRGSVHATTAESHGGIRSLMLEGGGDEGGINSAVQIVPIDPTGATKYKMSGWIKVPSGTGRVRARWMFDDGNGAGQYTDISGETDWLFFDQGENDIIPPAGSTRIIFRVYFVGGQVAAYLDDLELVAEPSGQPPYPGVTGFVRDPSGNLVSGAVVFLKNGDKPQEFANASATTGSAGAYTVCTKEDGTYKLVAWKQGYGLSQEYTATIANGAPLATHDFVLTQGSGGRNLAISTPARPTAVGDIETGRSVDPQFQAAYLFDGNTVSTRYYNTAAAERWVWVDLDPVGKGTLTANEFVLYGLGVTQMTEGWPGLDMIFPKDFAIEYTTKDPATETEAGWTSHTAFSITEAAITFAPVVIRLPAPITARGIRLRATNPAGGGFGPVELQVNSDKLSRGTITGIVKDVATGKPVSGARVYRFRPASIQSDPDIYGYGPTPPFVYAEEMRNGTPYDIAQSKTIEQVALTDAAGRYTVDANPGQPTWITAAAEGYPFATAIVTPPDDGTAGTKDFDIGKSVTVSGVVKDASGPIYNAVVQIGSADSQNVAITGADGKYNLVAPAGSQEIYADAYGHAGKTETLTLSANVTKDITLDVQNETAGLAATFESADGWEIGKFDVDWKSVGTTAYASSANENTTPGGKNSALIETANVTDAAGKELDTAYLMLQRTAAKRISVEAGKTYNVYFRAKSENWVSPEHQDACHFRLRWLDASGAVVGQTYAHPHWINPQPFWQTYSRGHVAGTDRSAALVRVTPPAGAAALDLKIGWVRLPSGVTDEKPDGTNPAGSQLFVDDLVVDAFGSAAASGQPTELGQTVSGFQDDFTGTTRDPNWKPRGPGGDLYQQADGLLRVSVRTSDPNHLLYEAPGYSTNVQEVLARMRIVAFGVNADGPRAGLAVGVTSTNSQGINLHFRNYNQDAVNGRQFKLLDDARAWGPAGLKIDWQTNTWYWLRLRQEQNAGGGTNDVFGKVWLADGATPEPSAWQLNWNYIPTRTERAGFAGITGSSIDGVGNFEVDYILIKAAGLPNIKVDFAPLGPAPTTPAITSVGTAAGKVRVDWIGAAELQSATDVAAGPWAPVANAASPYSTSPTGTEKFYRLKW